jgi:hypothetical protein
MSVLSTTYLVDGDPIGHAVAETFEEDPGVGRKVRHHLGMVPPRSIAGIEGFGRVPMKDGHDRFNAVEQ